VILKDGVETDHSVLRKEMSDMISARIGKFAKPEAIVVSSLGMNLALLRFASLIDIVR
jgi:acyl-coenzyme A synthetase/AMP-(fatty) acid ligase